MDVDSLIMRLLITILSCRTILPLLRRQTSVAVGAEGTPIYICMRLILFGGATTLEGIMPQHNICHFYICDKSFIPRQSTCSSHCKSACCNLSMAVVLHKLHILCISICVFSSFLLGMNHIFSFII